MTVHALGFADAVTESQQTFRAIMEALSRPGTIRSLASPINPPAPLTAELAMVALTLADHEASLWLDPTLAKAEAVADYLRFHTGAALVGNPADAAFALVRTPHECSRLERFAAGTPEYPDRSTTLVLAVETLTAAPQFILRGPGIAHEATMSASPMLPDFLRQWQANRARFPRGIDAIVVASGCMVGLPRTVMIEEA